MQDKINELQAFIKIAEAAQSVVDLEDVPWEQKYDVIFSPEISGKAVRLDSEFVRQWADPDTSYEEDVRAFNDVLQSFAAEKRKILGAFTAAQQSLDT